MTMNVSRDCYIFHYHTHAYTLLSLERALVDIMQVKVERSSQSVPTLPVNACPGCHCGAYQRTHTHTWARSWIK